MKPCSGRCRFLSGPTTPTSWRVLRAATGGCDQKVRLARSGLPAPGVEQERGSGAPTAAACRKPEKKRAADASRTQAAPTLGWDASLSATPCERFTENGGEADNSRRAVRLPLLCQLRAPERGDSAAGILARRAVAKNGHRASAYLSRSGVDNVALPDRRPTLPDRPRNL